jgi:small subunit ribosomal protein S1
VLRVGQEVEVVVLNVDHERKRIGLSLKRREDDPWTQIQKKYQIGQLVTGTITKLAKFGAFARVEGEDEIEGLIHVSELSDGHNEHPRVVVSEGQTLTLRVIKIEPDKRRMGLSLKRVASAEYADTDWEQVAAAIPDLDDVAES